MLILIFIPKHQTLRFSLVLHNADQIRYTWVSATINYDGVVLPDFNFLNITHTSVDVPEGGNIIPIK